MAREQLEQLKALIEDTAAALPPDAELSFKFMFGGMGAFTHGRMFAVLVDEGIGLKLPPDAQTELMALDGAHRWQHSPEAVPSKHYIILPQALHQPDELQPWLIRSVSYAQTLPLPKKRGTTRKNQS